MQGIFLYHTLPLYSLLNNNTNLLYGLDMTISGIITKEFLLENYVKNGDTLKDIADRFGVTPSAIRYYTQKHDIPMRDPTKHTEKQKRRSSETKKKNYASGKTVTWNLGLNKETNTSIMRGGKKASETKKKQFASGEVSNWWKGKDYALVVGEKRLKEISEETSTRMKEHWKNNVHPKKGKTIPHPDFCQCPFCRSSRGECVGTDNNFYGKTHSDEFKKWKSESQIGDKNHMWKGGVSFDPYPEEFNPVLKRKIRERDNYTCLLCKTHGTHVHHIDYDKDNCEESNLVTLCGACHGKTNADRDYWKSKLTPLLS